MAAMHIERAWRLRHLQCGGVGRADDHPLLCFAIIVVEAVGLSVPMRSPGALAGRRG
jgi:hypothetical protein